MDSEVLGAVSIFVGMLLRLIGTSVYDSEYQLSSNDARDDFDGKFQVTCTRRFSLSNVKYILSYSFFAFGPE